MVAEAAAVGVYLSRGLWLVLLLQGWAGSQCESKCALECTSTPIALLLAYWVKPTEKQLYVELLYRMTSAVSAGTIRWRRVGGRHTARRRQVGRGLEREP